MCPCKHHYKRSAVCTCDCSHGRVRVIEDEAVAGVVGPNSAGIFIPDGAFEVAEPEDKDDLYVEPEPLKEDDAVLLWARVVDAKPDSDGEVEVSLRRADGYQTSYATTYTLPDAIVRPDAGQVETWLEVETQPGGYIGYYLVYPRWRRWLIAQGVAA